MKKILLSLSLLIGLVSLSSCEEQTSITYVDQDGKEQTLEVSSTNDKEVVQKVLDYAISANYENITSFKLEETASMSFAFSKEFNQMMELNANDKFQGSVSMTLNASQKEGLDVSLKGSADLGKEFSVKGNSDILYEGALDQMSTSNEDIYVSASYDMKGFGTSNNSSIKKAIGLDTIIENAENGFDEIISNFLPNGTPSEGEEISVNPLKHFYENFKNSQLIISNVKNGVIYLKANLAVKDLINFVDPDNEELKPLAKLDVNFILTYGVEASTGRFREISFEFDDVKLLNFLLSNLNYPFPEMPTTLVQSFSLESKMTIEYNKAKIRTLSATEKAKYPKEA